MPNPIHEALRISYRPDPIRVLFLGESPPIGGTFFYADLSNLRRWTQAAFATAFEKEWESGNAFLRDFAAMGCYLDDLCLDPVNGMAAADRRRQHLADAPGFAARMRAYQPQVLVSVMISTARAIHQAVELAELTHLPLVFMPFPTHGNQHKYVTHLSQYLIELQDNGLLPTQGKYA